MYCHQRDGCSFYLTKDVLHVRIISPCKFLKLYLEKKINKLIHKNAEP